MSVELLNESGVVVDEQALVRLSQHVLGRLGVSPLADVSLLVTDLAEMERIHLRYLGEPGPTDVLAFPMDELNLRGSRGVGQGTGAQDGAGYGEPGGSAQLTHLGGVGADGMPTTLGDVVLCPVVAERQALEAGHDTASELQMLCVHGLLHLLGYDHEEPAEHAEMFGLQAQLLESWVPTAG